MGIVQKAFDNIDPKRQEIIDNICNKLESMILLDKAKEDFEKWVTRADKGGIGDFFDSMVMKEYEPQEDWDIDFYSLPFSMQYGILVDWFDSVGIYIDISKVFGDLEYRWWIEDETLRLEDYQSEAFKTRTQARQKAIEKANEIYNNRV